MITPLSVPDDMIPCTLLWRAFGLGGYDKAQRTLAKSGWVYLIGYDAWFAPAGRLPRV